MDEFSFLADPAVSITASYDQVSLDEITIESQDIEDVTDVAVLVSEFDQGVAGPPGADGPAGPQGIAGPPGPQGSGATLEINLLDPRFGAVGDGVADDTAAVQAAFDEAAGAAGDYANATIRSTGGRFKITQTLTLNGTGQYKCVSLIGDGPLGTQLQWHGASDGTLIEVRKNWHFKMSGVLFTNATGVRGTTHGVVFRGAAGAENSGGTQCSGAVLSCVLVENFHVGMSAGVSGSLISVSEFLYLACNFVRNDVGWAEFGQNTLNQTFVGCGFSLNGVGIHAGVADLRVYGGTFTANDEADIVPVVSGSSIVIDGARSEEFKRFVKLGGGGGGLSLTISNCQMTYPANRPGQWIPGTGQDPKKVSHNPERIAIELGGAGGINAKIINSFIDGVIYAQAANTDDSSIEVSGCKIASSTTLATSTVIAETPVSAVYSGDDGNAANDSVQTFPLYGNDKLQFSFRNNQFLTAGNANVHLGHAPDEDGYYVGTTRIPFRSARRNYTSTEHDLRILKGLSGTTTQAKNLRGSVTISGLATTAGIVFPTPEIDANYFVTANVSGETGTPLLGSARLKITGKSATGFTVAAETAPGVGSSVTVDWHLIR